MTTVGYGDKAPVTFAGRILAVIWMFVAIITISSFTAAITATLTVTQLESPINGPEDLPKVRVATTAGSTSESYLQYHRISYMPYQTTMQAMEVLANGQTDTVVYDEPILRYLVKTEFKDQLAVLPRTFERQDYAIALPEGSPLREPINRALVEIIRKPQWQEVMYRYMDQ